MGFVMRRERQVPWSAPLFPYMGWIMLGWGLTFAAVETSLLHRVLDTVSLTGAQWALVLGLSVISPLFVAVDKLIQIRKLDREQRTHPFAGVATATRD
jgi:Ca2+-transporting ATPase